MKTIGLLGGMSWESTAIYYRLINEGIKHELGGLHSAKIILYSVDLDPIEKLVDEGDWDKTSEILSDAALRVQSAGADCLLICCNTVHRIAPQIEKAIQIPLLHIADAAARHYHCQYLGPISVKGKLDSLSVFMVLDKHTTPWESGRREGMVRSLLLAP